MIITIKSSWTIPLFFPKGEQLNWRLVNSSNHRKEYHFVKATWGEPPISDLQKRWEFVPTSWTLPPSLKEGDWEPPVQKWSFRCPFRISGYSEHFTFSRKFVFYPNLDIGAPLHRGQLRQAVGFPNSWLEIHTSMFDFQLPVRNPTASW